MINGTLITPKTLVVYGDNEPREVVRVTAPLPIVEGRVVVRLS